jgi:putative transposase
MQLAHKIRIYPNHNQTIQLAKACGTARFTYNWALNKWNELYKQGIKTNAFELKKEWNQVKPSWVYESPKDANQQPFANLNKAFQNFFKKRSKYPTFKKKGRKDSFYISNDKFYIRDKKVKLPKIGWIKLAEKLRFNGKITNGTISRISNQWFISIQLDIDDFRKERKDNNKVGIDVGLNHAVTLSNGKQYQAPKPFKNQKKKIAKLNRNLARKIKFSKNWLKAKLKLGKAYLRLSNIRNDFWHKMTSTICNENQVICVEDLNVKGMIKNRKLSFTLADVGLGEFFRQLNYKKDIWDNEIYKVGRFFPSSQLCSNCGHKKKLSLSERIYICDECGVSIDRDINAAMNILTEGYSGNYACGQITTG